VPAHSNRRSSRRPDRPRPRHRSNVIFDDRLVQVEAVSAEISVTQPREIALYLRAFSDLAASAVHGSGARKMIMDELDALGSRS
jgi:hypothetical protein